MVTTVKKYVGKDSSGRNVYSGSNAVGLKKRNGGGYERGEVPVGESSNTVVELQRKEREAAQAKEATDKINQERIDAGKPILVGTNPPARQKPFTPETVSTLAKTGAPLPTGVQGPLTREQYAARQAEVITSPLLNRPISRAELEAAQAKATTTTRNQGTVQPANTNNSYLGRSTQYLEEKSGRASQQAQLARIEGNAPKALGQSAVAFATAGILVVPRTAQAVTSPVQTAKGIIGGAKRFARAPVQTTVDVGASAGNQLTTSPASFLGSVAGEAAVGYGVGKGVQFAGRGVNELRFIGKAEEAGLVNPKFGPPSAGLQTYPTGTLREIRREVDRSGVVFSASPERLFGGRGTGTVLTQADKKAMGLDLSESGGLYVAEKISPKFTGLDIKLGVEEASSSGFSLVPRFGSPGSVQKIRTEAGYLPKNIVAKGKRTRSIAEANEYLDTRAAFEQPGKALPTPAKAILGKTESELIIPGNSVLQRTKDFNFFQRATKTDFESYTRVPVEFNPQGVPTKYRKVALREYTNVGAKKTVNNRRESSAGDTLDELRSRSGYRPSEAGVLRVAPVVSRGGYYSERSFGSSFRGSIGSSAKVSGSRSSVPSSGKGLLSSSPGSVAPRSGALRSRPASYSYSSPVYAPGSYAPPALPNPRPAFYTPRGSPSGDLSIKQLRPREGKIGSDKFNYAPTFTAAFFGIKASKKQRKAILAATQRGVKYTGTEVIRPLL